MSRPRPKPHMDQLVRVDVKESGAMAASFDLDPSLINVVTLRKLIEAETGLDPSRQRLIARGRVLKDDDLLSMYMRTFISPLRIYDNISFIDGTDNVITIFMTEVKTDVQTSSRQVVNPSAKERSDLREKAFAPIASVHTSSMYRNIIYILLDDVEKPGDVGEDVYQQSANSGDDGEEPAAEARPLRPQDSSRCIKRINSARFFD